MESPAVCFGGFRLEPDGTLLRGNAIVHLPPKELAALQLLLAHRGQVVSPAQLKKTLWGDVHVTAESIPKCLSSLRARLEPEDCIQTVYKRGYRFSAPVQEAETRPTAQVPRLAILPFATGYAVPEHLGPAVAEEAIARLANSLRSRLTMLARDSVFTLAKRDLTAEQIGRALKADLVLAGALYALPAHYRLRIEMIQVADDAQIWVEDILVSRNRIAGLEAELVNRLIFRMGIEDAGLAISAAGDETGPQHREAYEIFQRAHHEWRTLERHRMQDGLQHLSRATELDPSLISAKIDLAHLCVTQAFYGFMSPTVAAELVYRTAESIPGFPDQAEAMLPVRGWVNFHVDHNLSAALWAFSNSARLRHDPWTTRVRTMFALSRHRFGEAIELLQSALREDPFSPWLQNRLAWALHLDGQADESEHQVRMAMARFPDHEGTSLYGPIILAYNGQVKRAVEMAGALSQRLPYFDLATAVHAYALACSGCRDEARVILERLQWLSRERFVLKSFNPAVHLALDDPESALGDLKAAREDRCPWYFQMLADPRLKALEAHPEFAGMKAELANMEAAAASEAEGNR
jgi:DNA-binding winged helix-turn-helix (wHTH) protein